MFIRLLLLVGVLYLGYLGFQTDAFVSLGSLEDYREVIVSLGVAVIAMPLLGNILH